LALEDEIVKGVQRQRFSRRNFLNPLSWIRNPDAVKLLTGLLGAGIAWEVASSTVRNVYGIDYSTPNFDDYLDQESDPASPTANHTRLYSKASLLYTKNPSAEVSKVLTNAITHGSAQHDATSLDTTAKLLAQNIRPTYNRLAGVTATFDTFDTNPSSPGNMTDGDWTTETGYGVKSLAGVSGAIGKIYFDMGAPYPVLIIARANVSRSSGDGTGTCTVYSKVLTGDSYQSSGYYSITAKTTDAYYPFTPVFTYARYINLQFGALSVTVNPSVFNVKVAEVMALQLF